jgi:hypothetical protein
MILTLKPTELPKRSAGRFRRKSATSKRSSEINSQSGAVVRAASLVFVLRYLNNTSTTDTGVLVLGGVEIFFEKVPKLGVSGELEFTPSSSPFASVSSVGGAGFVALAHWYFK